jgi:hypothetical protein
MKKLLWTALVAVTSAAAAALTMRGLRFVWIRVTHELPPERPWWARKLVANPLRGTVHKHVERA